MSTLQGKPVPPSTAHVAFDYAQVDVFAERPLEGNPLAVFTDARGLSDAEMQAFARETNLSETTFIFPRAPEVEHEHGVRVRIFTVDEELPFAGHPTLGTASWLYWNHPWLRAAEEIVLDLNVGPIPVRFTPSKPGEQGIFATMRQNDPVFGDPHDPSALAKVLQLSLDDLDRQLPAQTFLHRPFEVSRSSDESSCSSYTAGERVSRKAQRKVLLLPHTRAAGQ